MGEMDAVDAMGKMDAMGRRGAMGLALTSRCGEVRRLALA